MFSDNDAIILLYDYGCILGKDIIFFLGVYQNFCPQGNQSILFLFYFFLSPLSFSSLF